MTTDFKTLVAITARREQYEEVAALWRAHRYGEGNELALYFMLLYAYISVYVYGRLIDKTYPTK